MMAAYNNGYPVTYQQYYPQYQAQQYQTPQTGIIWVQGEAGAKSYMVAPNTTVQLWDSENQVIYLKSTDASGMPSMKVLDYTVRNNAVKAPSTASCDTVGNYASYATKAEIEAVYAKLEAVKADVESLMAKKPRTRKETDDE